MQEAFGYVLFGTVGIAALIALIMFLGTGRLYDQIGRGGLSLNEDGVPRGPKPVPGAAAAERTDEIRQLLEARSAVRQARGRPPLDVEAELARLTAPAADPEVVAEVRAMVERANDRRVRRGEAPLDVEAEVARRLEAFGAG